MPKTTGNVAEALHYTQAAAATLRDIASSTDVPFLATIAALSIAIIPLVQVVMYIDEYHSYFSQKISRASKPTRNGAPEWSRTYMNFCVLSPPLR
jgi:hypothetical protein